MRLARISGFEVRAGLSVLVIAGLIAYELAEVVLPRVAGGASTSAYWVAGVVVAVVYLAGILAHEVAHALVAQREGLVVEGIDLWMLGGVTKMRGEAASPGVSLRIAGVGPLVSVVLGVVFLVGAGVVEGVFGRSLPSATLGWLGVTNLGLGVFNLLPAAPLDGGRILAAGLWKRTGKKQHSQGVAGKVGRYFGGGVVVLGVVEEIFTRGGSGLWYIFLGGFLYSAASAEEKRAGVLERLEDVSVGMVMDRRVGRTSAERSVASVMGDWSQGGYQLFVLTGPSGRAVGVSVRERLSAAMEAGRAQASLFEEGWRLADVVSVSEGEGAAEAVAKGAESALGRAVVVAGDEVVGVVGPAELEWYLRSGGVRGA